MKNTIIAKTLRRDESQPEKAEIETPLSIGRRINVEYDLPQKGYQWRGYAEPVEVKCGKALGVFEVTDIYLNMLVNPNFIMIELTSRDEKFDKIHPDSKVMLIDEAVVLRRMKEIDEKMVIDGLENDIISSSEKNTVQQFKDLAKQYGFKVLKDGEAYRLFAKKTDNRWTRWISYYPEKEAVSFFGNTDYLNIWLCDTRKDFTPEICLNFVEDLNSLFELKGEDKFLVKDLIDPEDWQEIAGVPDASEDKCYSPAIKKDIVIYKIDNSKLIKRGEEGYLPGQEQAKIYFDSIPTNEEFDIDILDETMKIKIAEMLGINADIKEKILFSVDNRDSEHISMTAYYRSSTSKTSQHYVVSYANVDRISNYELANKVLDYIGDTLHSQLNKKSEISQKSVDNIISYATQILKKADNDSVNKNTKETEKEV